MKKLSALLAALVLAFALVACDDGGGNDGDDAPADSPVATEAASS